MERRDISTIPFAVESGCMRRRQEALLSGQTNLINCTMCTVAIVTRYDQNVPLPRSMVDLAPLFGSFDTFLPLTKDKYSHLTQRTHHSQFFATI